VLGLDAIQTLQDGLGGAIYSKLRLFVAAHAVCFWTLMLRLSKRPRRRHPQQCYKLYSCQCCDIRLKGQCRVLCGSDRQEQEGVAKGSGKPSPVFVAGDSGAARTEPVAASSDCGAGGILVHVVRRISARV